MNKKIIVWYLFALAVACNKTGVAPATYMKYVESKKNGLLIEDQINGYSLTLQFKPTDYVSLIELKNIDEGNRISEVEFDSLKKIFGSAVYFTLTIQNLNGGEDLIKSLTKDSSEAQHIFNYLNFEMQNDLHLVYGDDTLKCLLFHYEHNYGLSPYNKFLIGFEKKYTAIDHDLTIIYDDRILNGGRHRFCIEKEKIVAIPLIKI